MGTTIDQNDPDLKNIRSDGMQEKYLVLSDEERSKGFIRPVRNSYKHLACGTVTRMGQALSETYARQPDFYTGTFCVNCGKHFPLIENNSPAFLWESDGLAVGS